MDRTRRVIACIACLFALHISNAPAQSSQSATTTELPRGIRPLHYDIELTPDVQALTFEGAVRISLEIVEPATTITLHALDLSFTSARLSTPTRSAYAPPRIESDADAQTATFVFGDSLPPGLYEFALVYTGKIGTSPAGLFAIDYDGESGRERALYTQLAIADARRVFPSWDEPEYKATFSLSAVVPSQLMPVSNMPIAKRSDMRQGKSRVEFGRTPRMSTYLLFFAAGQFDRSTTKVGTTELGVITRRGASSQAAFVLDSSARVLREFNEYFAVPYPLPKLDNIAAPGSSQAFAAMENWGAIFSFEYVLLLDPSISTQLDKQNAFEIAAHEIAHQWFGNLVTMRWWDDLWLNEGFASWLEDRTTQRLHPEWNTHLNAVNTRERAMARDALTGTHPIVQPIKTVQAANQAFDAITYLKGRAVLAMLESYAGEVAWRDGVRRYIKANQYGSTVSDDLWREIESASKQPITAIAHDFTLQAGVPLIRVDEPVCRDGKSTVRLTQTEFSRDRPNKQALTWRVPIIAKSLGATTPTRHVIERGNATIELEGCEPVIVNAGQSGYYRTVYSPSHFQTLATRFQGVAPIDQLGLLSDAWALSLSGHQPVSDVMSLASAVPVDADPQVWGKIIEVLDELNDYYRIDPARQAKFRDYAIARLTPLLARVGWRPSTDEPEPISILRSRLISALGSIGDPAVIAESRRRYAARATRPDALPASLRKTIVAVVAQHADEKTWTELRASAAAEKTPLVKEQLYEMVAIAENPDLAKRALELALTSEPGATNSPAIISAVAWKHPDLAFDFALAHLDAVHAMLDPFARATFVPNLAARSHNADAMTKVERYAAEHLPSDARTRADAAIASIRDRMRVQRERLPSVDAWLASKADN